MKRRIIRGLIIVLLVVLLLLIPVILVEMNARDWVAAGVYNMNIAALDSDYTPQLHAERNDPARSFTWHYDGNYYTADDYAGTYINQRGGVRVTTDQPDQAPHTLYLFGNSVAYGVTNSDRNTIASTLQRLTKDYQIINEGSAGSGTLLLASKLKVLPLKPGDVVIFFNGIDEMGRISKIAHNQNPDPIARVCDSLTLVACSRYTLQTVPFPLLDPSWLREQLSVIRDEIQTSLRNSASYTRSKGVRFIWILQGDMWSLPLSANEARISVDVGDEYSIARARPVLQSLVGQLQSERIEAYDFSHTLDAVRLSGKEVFEDTVHLNAAANAVIAQAIFDILTVI